MQNLANNLLVPVVTIVGLIVLTALDKASASVTLPLIVGIAGLHTGLNSTPNAPEPTVPVAQPPVFAKPVPVVTGNPPTPPQ